MAHSTSPWNDDSFVEFLQLVDGLWYIIKDHTKKGTPLNLEQVEFIFDAIKFRASATKDQTIPLLTKQEKKEYELAKQITREAVHGKLSN